MESRSIGDPTGTPSLSVIIPTLQAGQPLRQLLSSLRDQTVPPGEILIIDSSSTDGTPELAATFGCRVQVIPKESFRHGATRNICARQAQGQILAYMTQDALPTDVDFLEALTRPIRQGHAAAAYARQVPYPGAPPPEIFGRAFNYPPRSHIRSVEDVPRLGFKAFFFSNVASAVDKSAFWAMGGFPEWVIMDEDVLLCARLLRAGYRVAYQAEAAVYHSHRYTLGQQFKRYFDIGAFVAQAGELLAGAHTSGEGLHFVAAQVACLCRARAWPWVPYSLVEAAYKYVAFQLGKRHTWLPQAVKEKLSFHPFFWKSIPSGGQP